MVLVGECVSGMQAAGIDQWDEIYPDAGSIGADIRSGAALVAVRSGEITGYVALNEEQEPEYADVPWSLSGRAVVVHRLMVAPSVEGQGVARALLRMTEARAKLLGYDGIRLDVFGGNARALRFYAREGYRWAGRVRFRKGDFDCLEKPLG